MRHLLTLTALVVALVFTGSDYASDSAKSLLPGASSQTIFDLFKLAHAAVFAGVGFAFALPPDIRRVPALMLCLIAALFAETLQIFTATRIFALSDVLLNFTAAATVAMYRLGSRHKIRWLTFVQLYDQTQELLANAQRRLQCRGSSYPAAEDLYRQSRAVEPGWRPTDKGWDAVKPNMLPAAKGS